MNAPKPLKLRSVPKPSGGCPDSFSIRGNQIALSLSEARLICSELLLKEIFCYRIVSIGYLMNCEPKRFVAGDVPAQCETTRQCKIRNSFQVLTKHFQPRVVRLVWLHFARLKINCSGAKGSFQALP